MLRPYGPMAGYWLVNNVNPWTDDSPQKYEQLTGRFRYLLLIYSKH